MSGQSFSTDKDGIKTITHPGFVLQYVDQVERKKNVDNAHEAGQPNGGDGAVDATITATNSNAQRINANVRTGIFFDGRQYLIVYGQRLYTFDELELDSQDGNLSGQDLRYLRWVMKYVGKAAANMSAATD